MRRHVKDDKRTCFILISSSDAPNLKTLLRVLNQKATSVEHDLDDEDIDERSTSPRKLLPYDLQILHEWCQARGVQQVVVAFQDAEAFETGVLSEVLLLFKYDKGHFVIDLLERTNMSAAPGPIGLLSNACLACRPRSRYSKLAFRDRCCGI